MSGLVAAQKLKWEGTWCRTGGSTEGSVGRDLVPGLAAQKLTWEHGKGPSVRTGGSTEANMGRDLVSGLVAAQKLTWEGTWCQDWWQHRS